MTSDIQGSKKTAIVFGLIATGVLALGVHQDNRWMIGGGIGLGALTGLAWIGIRDDEKLQLQQMHNTLDLLRLEEKPFSAKFFAGMSNLDIATAENFLNREVAANSVNSKDVDMEDGTVVYIFPVSQHRRAELETLKSQREAEMELKNQAEARQKRKEELKALNLSELTPEYLESLSEEERQLLLEAKAEQETEKAVTTTVGIGAAAVGLAVLSIFLGGGD
ncbi:MAG: hypothetical protein DCF19_20035 [Pseudanabaena frigida]|uniref:Uncharacterized protein n=1 Tax=Pseudanabaena frigida TaxID=945775 RepID=A0A2W4VXA3_9CYAN|nr:MAG: hypothetical protein DCF19_20035 [Pseudanabaena frigida]